MLNLRCLETSKDVKQVTGYMGCTAHFLPALQTLSPPYLQPREADLHRQTPSASGFRLGVVSGQHWQEKEEWGRSLFSWPLSRRVAVGLAACLNQRSSLLWGGSAYQVLCLQSRAAFLLVPEYCAASNNFPIFCPPTQTVPLGVYCLFLPGSWLIHVYRIQRTGSGCSYIFVIYLFIDVAKADVDNKFLCGGA